MIDSYHVLRAFSMLGAGLSYLWHMIVPQQSCEKDTIYSHFIDEENEAESLSNQANMIL